MSVPKKRRTRSSAGQRRSHHRLKKITLNKCSQCGQAVAPHRACSFCGYYQGRKAIKIKLKTKKNKSQKQK